MNDHSDPPTSGIETIVYNAIYQAVYDAMMQTLPSADWACELFYRAVRDAQPIQP